MKHKIYSPRKKFSLKVLAKIQIVGYLWNWLNLQKNKRRRQRACGPLITASGGDRVVNAYFCVFADKQTHKQTKYAILPLQIDS